MRKNCFLWSVLAMIMVGVLSAGLVACGDDEDDDDPAGAGEYATAIIGRWSVYEFQDEGESYVVPVDDEDYQEVVFKPDGVYEEYEGGVVLDEYGKWSISGNKLTIRSSKSGGVDVSIIKSLTSNRLVLQLDDEEIEVFVKGSRLLK
jgi:hypothetical protein